MAWMMSDEGKAFMRQSSDAWRAADIAGGSRSREAATNAKPPTERRPPITDDHPRHRVHTGATDYSMHCFDVLGDPVRRRILELLADGEHASGEVVSIVQKEFDISQPAVSQHLKVLRESGFATVRNDGTRRVYAVDTAAMQEVDVWLDKFRGFWNHKLNALATEVARGKSKKRRVKS